MHEQAIEWFMHVINVVNKIGDSMDMLHYQVCVGLCVKINQSLVFLFFVFHDLLLLLLIIVASPQGVPVRDCMEYAAHSMYITGKPLDALGILLRLQTLDPSNPRVKHNIEQIHHLVRLMK